MVDIKRIMQTMSEKLPLIDGLPERLVTFERYGGGAERFGAVALAAVLTPAEHRLVFGRFPEVKSVGWGEGA